MDLWVLVVLSMKIIRWFQIFGIIVLLNGCSDFVCIDADDFGFSYVNVPAGYESKKIRGSGVAQYVDWYDSDLKLNGNNIYMIVKQWSATKNINSSKELSAWCPWLGPARQPPSLHETCIFLDYCIFNNNDTCAGTQEAQILNAPCLLRHGIGLYFAATPQDFDPNTSPNINAQPHLADSRVLLSHMKYNGRDDATNVSFGDFVAGDSGSSSGTFVSTGGFYQVLNDQQSQDLKNGNLYFKILDRFYEDNSGQYLVQIKSGVLRTDWRPEVSLVKIIKDVLFGSNPGNEETNDLLITETEVLDNGFLKIVYNNVINNPNYKLAVSALLTIYLIYTFMQFLLGNSEMNTKELMTVILKIIIISQLLSADTAWTFFNQYLFSLFFNGSAYLLGLLGSSFDGETNIVSLLLTPQLYIKLSSLPFLDNAGSAFGIGIAYMIILIISILIAIWGVMYSLTVYVLCLMMISMLIILAPIFLCFVLFDQTKGIFDKWLQYLISFSLQTIILMAGVSMFSVIIKDQIYKNLGFRVCQKILYQIHTQNAFNTKIVGNQGRTASIYFWKPKYLTPEDGEEMVNIPLPNAHYEVEQDGKIISSPYLANAGAVNAKYCAPYQCTGMRYPSFPFLDPEDPFDASKLKRAWRGDLLSLQDVIVMFVCSLLMLIYSSNAVSVAAFITGGFSAETTATKFSRGIANNVQGFVGMGIRMGRQGVSYGAQQVTRVGRAMGIARGDEGSIATRNRSSTDDSVSSEGSKEGGKSEASSSRSFFSRRSRSVDNNIGGRDISSQDDNKS